MIPNNDNYDEELDEEFESDFILEEEPSLTYAMQVSDDIEKDSTFLGTVDDEDAIKQAILKILNTERYDFEIYSWDYGVELQDLVGKSMTYVLSEIEQRIEDAVTADDRIDKIEDFNAVAIDKHTIYVSFTAVTVQQDEIEIESEVEV